MNIIKSNCLWEAVNDEFFKEVLEDYIFIKNGLIISKHMFEKN